MKKLPFFIVFILVLLDQLTKYLAVIFLKPIKTIPILDGIFSLTYLENEGAAFGILEGARYFFIIITIVILTILIIYYRSLPEGKLYNYLKFSIILIISGALGNFIDRVFLGYVIDFFHFTFINFPIFNMADIYVVIGTFLYAILLLFFIKE